MNDPVESAGSGGRNYKILGGIAIALGILAMLMPGLTGMSVIVFVGVIVLVAGIARMIWTVASGNLRRGVFGFAIGALTMIAGIILVAHPVIASGILTVLLAVYFILDGIVELATGVQMRPRSGAGWLMFAGIVSILLGVIIWSQFPLSGFWAIGILFGIKLVFIGLVMIAGGSALRSFSKQAGG
jgi:uncharacterized membrane protein HdeD (DUF308 family)